MFGRESIQRPVDNLADLLGAVDRQLRIDRAVENRSGGDQDNAYDAGDKDYERCSYGGNEGPSKQVSGS